MTFKKGDIVSWQGSVGEVMESPLEVYFKESDEYVYFHRDGVRFLHSPNLKLELISTKDEASNELNI